MDPNQQAQQAAQRAQQQAQQAHQQAHQQAVQQGWRFMQRARREDLQGRPGGTGVGGCGIFLAITAVMVLVVIGLVVFYLVFMVHPG